MNYSILKTMSVKSENQLYSNINGYKYEKGALDDALEEFKELIDKGKAFGYFEKDNHFKDWEEETPSHKILKFKELDDQRYEIELAILETKEGKQLNRFFAHQGAQPNMHQICELDEDDNRLINKVSSIPYINITPYRSDSAEEK